ncbi:FtsH protease modulator YccA, partial [Shigella sonnei]|nr:FtsH protease modulator YccA [Shigella sonnei]
MTSVIESDSMDRIVSSSHDRTSLLS